MLPPHLTWAFGLIILYIMVKWHISTYLMSYRTLVRRWHGQKEDISRDVLHICKGEFFHALFSLCWIVVCTLFYDYFRFKGIDEPLIHVTIFSLCVEGAIALGLLVYGNILLKRHPNPHFQT